jgi:diadenosine tetraphosphatase ApaH/serine/threonine PP2A family protein phosphatase
MSERPLFVNPGSVGAPLDGDRRAAGAVLANGEIEFRRTPYDVERAAAQMRTYGEWAETVVYHLEHGRDR